MTEEELKIKAWLEKDLYRISRLSGNYMMTTDCIKKWTAWYDQFDEDESGERICPDKSFSGWYSRKPTYIIKISMLQAAAESSKLLIEWHHIEQAIEAIKEVEYSMGNAFKAIGKSEISAEVDNVLQIIRNARCISEKDLMTRIWRDIDSTKFTNVIDTLIKTGKVRRTYKGPDESIGVWYWSTEDPQNWRR